MSSLKLLCDDVFGEENGITMFSRQMKSGGAKGKYYTPNIDYVLAYAKRIDELPNFKAIMTQFLIESVVIGVSGGLIGIAFGCFASVMIAKFGGFNTVITMSPILLSFSFSVGIGLFFGIYPARKAALLNPIEALRYE